jgi:hypothetical protein
MRRQAGQGHRVRLGLCATAIAFVVVLVAPPPHPSGPTAAGGALPVVPAGGGGCIIGLNCGCIRGITCPGAVHRRPAPANDHPHDPPAVPGG